MIKTAVIGGTHCICDKLTLTPLWEDYDILVISYMPGDLLVSTALGFETEITKALLTGKKVYVLSESTKHFEKCKKALFHQYKSHFDTIISYGVKLINCTDELFTTKNAKKLLNAADLEGLQGTVLRVSSHTIITPLALDIAKEKNINITKDDKL